MIKSAYLYLGLAALLALPAAVPAQDNSAALAVNEAVLRQAKTLDLRAKLNEAKAVAQHNDVIGAAKLYQEAVTLAQEIGSAGIEAESQQANAGLAAASLALAREAQARQDYHEADTRIKVVLKADPKNATALAMKIQNDQLMAAAKGHQPDPATLDQLPVVSAQKTQAATFVQDG